MKLKVFTLPTCKNCPPAKEISRQLAEKYGLEYLEVDISTSEGQLEGLMHQIMSTPSIALGDEVIIRGGQVSSEKLEGEIRKRLDDETARS